MLSIQFRKLRNHGSCRLRELTDKLHEASDEIVHCASNLDGSILLQFLQNWTASTNLNQHERDVRSGDSVNIFGILA